MGRDFSLQNDIFELMVIQGKQSKSTLLEKFSSNQSKYPERTKDPIRQKLVSLANDGLVDVICESKGRGSPKKEYSLTTDGAKWYLDNTRKNPKIFWQMLFSTSDYFYQFVVSTNPKPKSKFSSKYDEEYIVGLPKNRKNGLDFDKVVQYYEKNILGARTNSFLSKNVQTTFFDFEDMDKFEYSFFKKLQEHPKEYLNDKEYTSNEIKKIVDKNLKKFYKKNPQLKDIMNSDDLNFQGKRRQSQIYLFMSSKLKAQNMFSAKFSNADFDFLESTLGLTPYQRMSKETTIETLYAILLLFAESGKCPEDSVIEKVDDKKHQKWEYKQIIHHMYDSGLLLHWWDSQGYKTGLSQLGLLLVFRYIGNYSMNLKLDKMNLLSENSDKYKQELPEIVHEIRHIVSHYTDLFPKVFDNWPSLTENFLDDMLLQIFTQYYFTRNKFWLFPETRQIEIDLLQTQQYLEPTYRIELKNFLDIGKSICQQWIKKEKISFPIFEIDIDNKKNFSLDLKLLLRLVDNVSRINVSKFDYTKEKSIFLQDIKFKITNIVKTNSFPDSKFENMIFGDVAHYIGKKYYMDTKKFFLSLEVKESKDVKEILNDIKYRVIDSSKIIKKAKVLEYLLFLENLISDSNIFFGRSDLGNIFPDKIAKHQIDSTADFVSFQFYTDLMGRSPEIWYKIMSENNELKAWYLDKLQEINKIDKIRYERNLNNQKEIITQITSLK